jgi:hypothetical protein
VWPTIGGVAVFVGFGHSILAMSGEESLAQVYREIERPKIRNLQRAGLVIFVYSLVFTGLVSFFAFAIVPDPIRPRFYDNLISGIAMYLAGPLALRLLFQAFVVVVGFLILAGAANTAIVGSNGVLNRVAEDGVLPQWFRNPHKRFGTTYRSIALIAILQLIAIVLSRGDVYVLGEAYAFGVVWSFALKAIAVLVLRYRRPDSARAWRVPLNVRIAGREVPVGLIAIATILSACAVINLLTKQVATIAGVSFTLMFFVVFTVSEHIVARARAGDLPLDRFQLETREAIDAAALGIKRDGVLVAVRDYHTLGQLEWVLEQPALEHRDVVVVTVRLLGHAADGLADDQLFSEYEHRLFTRVVAVAERSGRTVILLVVPGSRIFDALAQAAAQMHISLVALGESHTMSAARQSYLLGEAWDRTPRAADQSTSLVVLASGGRAMRFALGAHAPSLSATDLDRIHRLWVEAVPIVGPDLHHRDVVTAALASFEAEFHGGGREQAIVRLRSQRS